MILTLSRLVLCAVLLASLSGCEQKPPKQGELSRGECVSMVVKIDGVRNKELGRANSVDQRVEVDRCMEKGTRAQFECVEFANNAAELVRCDELAR